MTAAFLGLEAALYAAFMTLDLTGGSGDPVKYASIAVCLVFSVLFARRGGSRLMAAAMALASVIPEEELSEENIIPKPFDPRVVPAVAAAVAEAARKTGVARKLS